MNFIKNCINNILNNHSDLSKITIILPNKTTYPFFKKEFSKKINFGFLPNFFLISEFTKKLSNLILIEKIPLWLYSYNIYKKIDPKEKIDHFLKWIPIIIDDFNNILRSSEEPKKIIKFLSSEQRIKNWNLKLNLSFYKIAKKDIFFYKKILIFYEILNKELFKTSQALEEMIPRIAYSNIIKNSHQIKSFYYFIGFNSLSIFEYKIIQYLIKIRKADIIIDADMYYLYDKNQESGFFLRSILNWKEINIKKINFIKNNFSKKKKIKEYPLGNSIMNAKIIYNILEKIEEKEYKNTGLILCDNNLILSTLQSIPKKINQINLNVSFSLHSLSITHFFIFFFEIKLKYKKLNIKGLYFNDLCELLNNNIFNNKFKNQITLFFNYLTKKKIFIVDNKLIINFFKNSPINILFKNYTNSLSLIKEIQNFINYMITYNKNNIINYQILIIYKNIFIKFYQIIKNEKNIRNIKTLYLIFKLLIKEEKNNFTNKFIDNAIYITDFFNSQLLNFKNLIILSVNDSILDKKNNANNSFIPFSVKDKFNINNFLNKESNISYYFYRLIQNAKNIHLVYEISDTEEKSRLIEQLDLESKHQITSINYEFKQKSNLKKIISIKKTKYIQNQILNWLSNGVSASALQKYIINPIDFYKTYILKINEIKNINTEISSKDFGFFIHKFLERIYKNYIGKELKIIDFISINKYINKYFLEFYKNLNINLIKFGFNYLEFQFFKKTIFKIINFDKQLVESGSILKILYLEKKIKINYLIKKNILIKFKGSIDRIDILNGVPRIIDYKSKSNISYEIEQKNIDKSTIYNIQMIIYSFYVLKKFKFKKIKFGIWSFIEANEGVKFFNYKIDQNNKNEILKCKDFEYEINKVKDIILEILDYKIPFLEKKIF